MLQIKHYNQQSTIFDKLYVICIFVLFLNLQKSCKMGVDRDGHSLSRVVVPATLHQIKHYNQQSTIFDRNIIFYSFQAFEM
jgi:hypothetical protein